MKIKFCSIIRMYHEQKTSLIFGLLFTNILDIFIQDSKSLLPKKPSFFKNFFIKTIKFPLGYLLLKQTVGNALPRGSHHSSGLWVHFIPQGCAAFASLSGKASLALCLALPPPIKALQADAHESYNCSSGTRQIYFLGCGSSPGTGYLAAA